MALPFFNPAPHVLCWMVGGGGLCPAFTLDVCFGLLLGYLYAMLPSLPLTFAYPEWVLCWLGRRCLAISTCVGHGLTYVVISAVETLVTPCPVAF